MSIWSPRLADCGADWDVTFLPFSLSQVHVPEGGTPVWDDPQKAPDLVALGAGVVVRDQYPDRFLDAHIALFAARHDEGLDLREPEVVAGCSMGSVCPATKCVAEARRGGAVDEIRRRPRTGRRSSGTSSACRRSSWADKAVFVRLMSRSGR